MSRKMILSWRPGKTNLPKGAWGKRLDGLFRRLTRKPYAVDELFGAALNQAELFNDLLGKVGGDRQAAERLVEYERASRPKATGRYGSRMTEVERIGRGTRDQWAVNSETVGR